MGKFTVSAIPAFLLARSSSVFSLQALHAVDNIAESRKLVGSNACVKCILSPAVTEVAVFDLSPAWYRLHIKRLTIIDLLNSDMPFRK